MTNAPADLLGLRSDLQQLTGLSAVDIGIVGDQAHARSGGYHIGKSGLVAAGVWPSDYSVRLTRDRNGATESASAVDVGAGWRAGRSAWLRWNNLLVAALHAGDPALAAVRAVNYSPDGTAKRRTDREAGWSVVSSSDTVDIHTHLEFYRDTEGRRQAALDRIVALAQQAITGQVVLTGDVTQDGGLSVAASDVILAWSNGVKNAVTGEYVAPVDWEIRHEAFEAQTTASLAAIASGLAAVATAVHNISTGGTPSTSLDAVKAELDTVVTNSQAILTRLAAAGTALSQAG